MYMFPNSSRLLKHPTMQEVYLNIAENTLSFTWQRNVNVCIGETDGSLEDFLSFMRDDWNSRGISLDDLPKIEYQENP